MVVSWAFLSAEKMADATAGHSADWLDGHSAANSVGDSVALSEKLSVVMMAG